MMKIRICVIAIINKIYIELILKNLIKNIKNKIN